MQEIVHNIADRRKLKNVVIKLDMAKAYDTVSWVFLIKALKKMGFGKTFIEMVYRTLCNNWYIVFVNGQPFGFFHSSRGEKQGDPLSPNLFLLVVECLSRALNALHRDDTFVSYGMPKWSPYLNHLTYVDDMIIFLSAVEESLKLVMETLASYELSSGHKINKQKSNVYMHVHVPQLITDRVFNITEIPRGDFPFKYHGVPIYYARRKNSHYNELMEKV